MRVLVLYASASPDSRSRALADEFYAILKASPKIEVHWKARDLSKDPIPHLDESLYHVYYTPNFLDGITPQEARKREEADRLSHQLINELRWCDILMIATPIYNWSIPSTLKSWIDYVVRVNETFIATDTGIEGLLQKAPATAVYDPNDSAPTTCPPDSGEPTTTTTTSTAVERAVGEINESTRVCSPGTLREIPASSYCSDKEVFIFVSSGMTPASVAGKYISAVMKFMGIRTTHLVEAVGLETPHMTDEMRARVTVAAEDLLQRYPPGDIKAHDDTRDDTHGNTHSNTNDNTQDKKVDKDG